MVTRTVSMSDSPARQARRNPIALVFGGFMVRKGGFEPPRLSAPPPQDGVSASSTTSALSAHTRRPSTGRRSIVNKRLFDYSKEAFFASRSAGTQRPHHR